MNRNLISLSFGVLFIFGVIIGIGAQTVDLQEISVKKNRPDEIFHTAATVVSFWITDEIGSFETIIKQDSHITVFDDDRGLNLIAAHYEEITAWEEKVKQLAKNGRYVSMGRSQELLSAEGLDEDEEVSGFYLTVESWALPSSGAGTLHIAGTINYIVALEEQAEEVFSELIPVETESLHADGFEIKFSDIYTDNGIVNFTIDSDLPVIDAFFYNSNGKPISEILYTMDGNLVMEMDEEYFNSAVRLELIYLKTKKVRVMIDEIVGLGL